MSKQTLNIAALDRVAVWLEAGAPHTATPGGIPVTGFDMSRGVAIDGKGCGTVCCIAGAVCQFEGVTNAEVADMLATGEGNWRELGWWGTGGVAMQAQEILGLTSEQADSLFTPIGYNSDEWEDDYRPLPAALAARVIRHLIATGDVNWELQDDQI